MLTRVRSSRNLLVPVFAVALLLAITTVPAGRGHLGGPTALNFNQGGESLTTLTDGQVSLMIGTRAFTHVIDPNGESLTDTRAALLALINDPNSPFTGTISTDPFDPSTVAFEVLTDGGCEVADMQLCETSTSLDELAAYISAGKDAVLIDVPTVVNGDGTYNLTLRMASGTGLTYSFGYATSIPPNNTATGLIASLKNDLTAAGFTVLQGTTVLSISRASATLAYVRVIATDTGIVKICTRLEPSSSVVPTLSQYGFFALVLLMTVAAVLMLRRKSSESGAASGY